MLLKTIVFAVLAVAVLADEPVSADRQAQLREMLRAQCKKNNAEDKVEQVENVGKNFVECVKGLINLETMQKEINEAKPNGALDEVFKKYCAKTPELKTCINTLLDGVSPCIDENVRNQMDFAKNGTNQLIDFVCFKDGDRIALFISEAGPECITGKLNEVRDCTNPIKDSITSVEAAKALSTQEKCQMYDTLSTCVVSKLESCSTSTPSNMAESLFRFVRRGSPCNGLSNSSN